MERLSIERPPGSVTVNEPKLGKLQLVGVINWKSLSWGLPISLGCSRSGCFGLLHCLMPFVLSLAAPYSKPSMNLEPNKDLKPGDLAAVTCRASRGYPEASVLWQDGQGSNITENVTTSQVANEDGLFDVHSVLQVLVEPSSTYSCLVRNPVLQQETQASVTITGEPARAKTGGRQGWALSQEGDCDGTRIPTVAQSHPSYPVSPLHLSPPSYKDDLKLFCPPPSPHTGVLARTSILSS